MRAINCTLTALAFAVSVTQAASVNIVNPGFETDSGLLTAGTTWSDNTPTGWLDPDNPGANPKSYVLENIGGFA